MIPISIWANVALEVRSHATRGRYFDDLLRMVRGLPQLPLATALHIADIIYSLALGFSVWAQRLTGLGDLSLSTATCEVG